MEDLTASREMFRLKANGTCGVGPELSESFVWRKGVVAKESGN